MFHKNNCQCCNNYIAHAIHACKEQGINLPIQAVGDALTKAWPMLMRDLEAKAQHRALESYKDLADDAASLKAELKASEAALDSERSRVERWDETIRDLKDEIAALKRPPSTVSTTSTSTQPIVQSLRAGPSSRPTAPLPARAHSGLAAQLSKPELASCIDVHPEADHYNDRLGNIADDVPEPDMSMPAGWESDPNWGSDASVWDEMRGPGDPPKPLSKKRKKSAHDYEHMDGWTAAHEKATREYLAWSATHTVVDDALKSELRMARRAFALQEAARAEVVVIPTPQCVDLTVHPRYPGEGEPLPHGGPPIPVTGCLPHPLG
jgi:hypothetical protein